MGLARVGAAVLFVLLLAWPFLHRCPRGLGRAVVLLGLASVVFGLLIRREWAVALPLSAVVFAVARGRGGDRWLEVSGAVCLYTVPGLALGLGLVAVVG